MFSFSRSLRDTLFKVRLATLGWVLTSCIAGIAHHTAVARKGVCYEELRRLEAAVGVPSIRSVDALQVTKVERSTTDALVKLEWMIYVPVDKTVQLRTLINYPTDLELPSKSNAPCVIEPGRHQLQLHFASANSGDEAFRLLLDDDVVLTEPRTFETKSTVDPWSLRSIERSSDRQAPTVIFQGRIGFTPPEITGLGKVNIDRYLGDGLLIWLEK